MTTSEDQFDVFNREYAAWHSRTQQLPFRRDRESSKGAFELDLDHLIDYVHPILAAAAKRSTQIDYPRVASEYLQDLDKIKAELESDQFPDSRRRLYSAYLAESQRVLTSFGSLPVPPEGHLGFRESALHAFSFLVGEHGFSIVETSPISVQFGKDTLAVKVEYSPACPMTSILVARRVGEQMPTTGFILDDFAYIAGLGVVFNYEQFNFGYAADLSKFLQAAASLVRRCGGPLLDGDDRAFAEFQSKADERERLYVEAQERQHSAPH